MIAELENHLCQRLSLVGYSVVQRSPKAKSSSSVIAGSRDVDWRSIAQKTLKEGEARVAAEVDEICLRIESHMGLYETRNGRSIVIKLEIGTSNEDG